MKRKTKIMAITVPVELCGFIKDVLRNRAQGFNASYFFTHSLYQNYGRAIDKYTKRRKST